MLHLVAERDIFCPKLKGNTYIQHMGSMLGQYGGNETKEPEIQVFDENAEETINNLFADNSAEVYCIAAPII